MVLVLGVHPAQHAELVRLLRGFRQQIHDLRAALPMLLETPTGAQELAVFLAALLSVSRAEGRLRIEGLHVWRSAPHAEKDHPLRARGEVRRLDGQRTRRIASGAFRR